MHALYPPHPQVLTALQFHKDKHNPFQEVKNLALLDRLLPSVREKVSSPVELSDETFTAAIVTADIGPLTERGMFADQTSPGELG